jgi:hypothetical protein
MHFMHEYLTKMAQGSSITAILAARDHIILHLSFYGLLRRGDVTILTAAALQIDTSKGLALAAIVRSKTD